MSVQQLWPRNIPVYLPKVDYSCIIIYTLVLAAKVLTCSKEYSAVAGIHKAVGQASPKIKPNQRLPSPPNSRPFTGRVNLLSRQPWLLRRVVGAQALARRLRLLRRKSSLGAQCREEISWQTLYIGLYWFILNLNKYFNNDSIVCFMIIQIFVLGMVRVTKRGPDLDTFWGKLVSKVSKICVLVYFLLFSRDSLLCFQIDWSLFSCKWVSKSSLFC